LRARSQHDLAILIDDERTVFGALARLAPEHWE
jgi:hypothetical protein